MHTHSFISHLPLLATLAEWAVALAWLTRAVDTYRNLPRVPDLLAIPLAPPRDLSSPLLSVIVPACNEEAAIAATLRSLLAQEGIALEIIAVDDRSSDRTGAIMDEVAKEADGQDAEDQSAGVRAGVGRPSLQVIHNRTLPQGWMGKPHALVRGVELSSAPYLLFTDGDIFFRPDALARAMQLMTSERADHLVLLPTPILKSAGEHMMISAIQVFSAWAVRLWRVPDPQSRDRLGVGAFNLVRREAYEAIGGFEALRMEVLEDVRLAVEIKRNGFRQAAAVGRDLVTLHWASGALGIVRNVTKNIFAATGYRVRVVFGGIGTLFLFGIFPVLGFFGPRAMQAASCVAALSIFSFYRLFRRHGGSPVGYALLFPAATLLLIYAMLRSMLVTLARGAVVWRGTSYSLKELRRMAGPTF